MASMFKSCRRNARIKVRVRTIRNEPVFLAFQFATLQVSGNAATGDGGGAYTGGNQCSIATSKVVNVGIQEG